MLVRPMSPQSRSRVSSKVCRAGWKPSGRYSWRWASSFQTKTKYSVTKRILWFSEEKTISSVWTSALEPSKVGEIIETKKGRTPGKVRNDRHRLRGSLRTVPSRTPMSLPNPFGSSTRPNSIREHNVAISIGGYSVIVKKINVQTMSEDQLQETIQFEAEQYIPFRHQRCEPRFSDSG